MTKTTAIPSFDDRDGTIWLDGAMCDWRDARLHVLSHGLHYASSVFEGERAYGGVIFESEWHTRRFRQSANIMDFDLPYDDATILKAKMDVLAANGISDGYVRPFAWRGSEMMAVSAQAAKIHVAIAAWEWPSYYDAETKMKGIRLDLAEWQRPPATSAPVHAKAAGLYMICTLAKHAAEKKGFEDALLLDNRGLITEATSANVFFVMGDGKLHTPTPDCFLNGITRQTVIKLVGEMGGEVVERHIKPEEMAHASECFLTGTAAEVTPVSQIGEYNFNPGRFSRDVMEKFAAHVRQRA